jgi:hypothetical protein
MARRNDNDGGHKKSRGQGGMTLGKLFGRMMKKKGIWREEWDVSGGGGRHNRPVANSDTPSDEDEDEDKNNEVPKQKISVRKEAHAMTMAEREAKIDRVRGELGNALEQVGRMMGQLERKDREMLDLWDLVKEKEGGILELQEELDRKEKEVVWVENQLEQF